MFILLAALLALSLAGVIGSIAALRSDGLRAVTVIDSRIPDHSRPTTASASDDSTLRPRRERDVPTRTRRARAATRPAREAAARP